MLKRKSRRRKNHDYGEGYDIAVSLIDGPLTLDEIVEHYHSYIRYIGLFNVSERLKQKQREPHIHEHVRKTVEYLKKKGWIVQEGERYELTTAGHEKAEKVLSELRQTGEKLQKFLMPEFVPRVSLIAHLFLAALKLPAGLISGSVGLTNDAVDTLLDGLSCLLISAGFRYDMERTVNVFLVLLMLVTGGVTFYEAVQRFFVPYQIDINWFTFVAAIFSAVVCLLLWFYQRFIGMRGGSMALITQSVDSRNHVIVAASVTAGLAASLLRFPLLDTLVGLVVAALILKSGVELFIDLLRYRGDEEPDFSRYKFGIVRRYEKFRQSQLCDWMLYLIEKQKSISRSELISRVQEVLDFSKNPSLRALGIGGGKPQYSLKIGEMIRELIKQNWINNGDPVHITEKGKQHLHGGENRFLKNI
ncbi:cation transporter [candidate division KSB1 bacterium]|nr:cation transporter [candidate division KSB1 bacterium]